jgi:hypothetical protein
MTIRWHDWQNMTQHDHVGNMTDETFQTWQNKTDRQDRQDLTSGTWKTWQFIHERQDMTKHDRHCLTIRGMTDKICKTDRLDWQDFTDEIWLTWQSTHERQDKQVTTDSVTLSDTARQWYGGRNSFLKRFSKEKENNLWIFNTSQAQFSNSEFKLD